MAGEQLANIDSQNVNDEVWLKLAKHPLQIQKMFSEY